MCSPISHTIHLVRRLSSATCLDRRLGVTLWQIQLPLSSSSSSPFFIFPSFPLFGRRVLSSFHIEALRPTANTPLNLVLGLNSHYPSRPRRDERRAKPEAACTWLRSF